VVHEDLTSRLLELLRTYQIDAALLALPLESQENEQLALFDEPFWFCLSTANIPGPTPSPFRRLTFATSGCCCWPRDTACAVRPWAACGRHADTDKELDDFSAVSLETIIQLVATGFGCTLAAGHGGRPAASATGAFQGRAD